MELAKRKKRYLRAIIISAAALLFSIGLLVTVIFGWFTPSRGARIDKLDVDVYSGSEDLMIEFSYFNEENYDDFIPNRYFTISIKITNKASVAKQLAVTVINSDLIAKKDNGMVLDWADVLQIQTAVNPKESQTVMNPPLFMHQIASQQFDKAASYYSEPGFPANKGARYFYIYGIDGATYPPGVGANVKQYTLAAHDFVILPLTFSFTSDNNYTVLYNGSRVRGIDLDPKQDINEFQGTKFILKQIAITTHDV